MCAVSAATLYTIVCAVAQGTTPAREGLHKTSVQGLVTRKQDKKRLSRHLLTSYSLQTVGEEEGFDKRDGHLIIVYHVIG